MAESKRKRKWIGARKWVVEVGGGRKEREDSGLRSHGGNTERKVEGKYG